MPAPPFSALKDGARLAVRVTPRASRDGVDRVAAGADGKTALGVRLRSPPVDGAANEALVKFLAAELKLRKSDITIHAGATSRVKIVHIAGDGGELVAALRDWIARAAS
jgi:uncharacterized protein (TIGR00251 family)